MLSNTGIAPQVQDEIIHLAQQYGLDRVLLFGSRARGDHHRASDIDLAVSGGDITRFSLDIDDETSTLLMFDVIDLSQDISQSLRTSIEQEGKTLYEKI